MFPVQFKNRHFAVILATAQARIANAPGPIYYCGADDQGPRQQAWPRNLSAQTALLHARARTIAEGWGANTFNTHIKHGNEGHKPDVPEAWHEVLCPEVLNV